MSLSKYPEQVDLFQTKVDAQYEGDPSGSDVMADDVNSLQDAITAIEKVLGVKPQGNKITVGERITLLEDSSSLRVPSFLLYLGNPQKINGSTTTDEAISQYTKFDHIVFGANADDVNSTNHQTTIDIINGIRANRDIKIYGYIDCGVNTANHSVSELQVKIQSWYNMGATGIYCGNFGFENQVTRDRQNQILDSIHQYKMIAIVTGSNPDQVLSDLYDETLNPNWIVPNIKAGDIYHYDEFVIDSSTPAVYVNASTTLSKMNKLYTYRNSLGIKIVATPVIQSTVDMTLAQSYYDYTHAFALLASVDVFHPVVEGYGNLIDATPTYDWMPIAGDWFIQSPNIEVNGSIYSRETSFGKINIDTAAHTTSYNGLYIPYSLLKIAANTIDGSLLKSGTVEDTKIKSYDGKRLIGSINADTSTDTIDIKKIATFSYGDISGSVPIDSLKANVIDAINAYIGTATIGEAFIGDLNASHITAGDISADRIKANIVTALNLYAQNMTVDSAKIGEAVIGDLHAEKITAGNIDAARIQANVVSAININAQGAYIQDLNADNITAGNISADRITANVVNAINLYASQMVVGSAVISSAAIGALTADHIQASVISAINASIDTATINNAKIGSLSVDNMKAAVVEAINLKSTNAQIDQARIGNLDATKITTGDLNADRIKGTVIDAINFTSQTAVIDQGKIGDLSADKITTGDLSADRIAANVVNAINAYAQTMTAGSATIDIASIGDLDAQHIKGAVIEAVNASIENATINAAKIGSLSVDNMKASVISAVNSTLENTVIDQGRIGNLDAAKITTGDLSAERIQSSVITAINGSFESITIDNAHIGVLTAEHIKGSVVEAINLNATSAVIEQGKIGNLDATKITTGDIAAARMTANAISAINADITSATIDAAQIANLTAGHIQAVAIDAINSYIGTATIGAAKIGSLGVDNLKAAVIEAVNASIETATINAAKIGSLDVDNIKASVINAINASIENATIDAAKIGSLKAENIEAEVLKAINASIETATIDAAKIGSLSVDNMKASVISAVNATLETAVIDQGKIGDLDAEKITTGDISADRMHTNVIYAINGHMQNATIDAAQIGVLQAGNIGAHTISSVNITTDGLDASTITTGFLDASLINVREIQGEQLTFDAITAWEISSDSIESRHLQADSISGKNIQAGTITAEHISTGGLDANSMFVYGKDGETLIGGGYLRVDGMDVGVIQSDNLIANGNFNIFADTYGYMQNNTAGETIVGFETSHLGAHEIWAYDMQGAKIQGSADPVTGAWSITTGTLTNGTYRAMATIINGATGTPVGVQSWYFIVDNSTALVEATNPDNFVVISDMTPTFSGTAGPGYIIDFGTYYIHRFPVSKKPVKMVQVFDPNPSNPKHLIFATSQADNGIDVLDVLLGSVVKTIPTGKGPSGIAISADQTKIYVANTDLNDESEPDYVSVIDVATLTVEQQVIVGTEPTNLYVSKKDGKVYILSANDTNVYIYDPTVKDIVGVISAGEYGKFSYGITMNADESIMYVSNSLADEIAVIDMTTQQIIHRIPTGDAPTEIALHPDGQVLYVTTSGANAIEAYETVTYSQVMSSKIGAKPLVLNIYPNPNKQGSYYLYVNCSGQNEIIIIDLDTNTAVGSLKTGQNPFGMMMHPYGQEFYIANNADNSFVGFTYPDGPYIGDAYIDSKAVQGKAVYNGALGWAPSRQQRIYDSAGSVIGASAVEFHMDELYYNQTGYVRLFAGGVGNQYAQVQQDTDIALNYSNGLPLQISNDECVLTSNLVYKASNDSWVSPQNESIYFVNVTRDADGYPVIVDNISFDITTAKTLVTKDSYTMNWEDGKIFFIEGKHPGYYGTFDTIFDPSVYTISSDLLSITFVESANVDKFVALLNHYAVDAAIYTVNAADMVVTFTAESNLLRQFKKRWPGISADYLYHENVWYNDYNASALITWDRPAPPTQHMAFTLEEFVPKYVTFENKQLTPFTPTKDNITDNYNGLTYSGFKNVAKGLGDAKITVSNTGNTVTPTYNYGMDNSYDKSRIVNGVIDSNYFEASTDGLSTVVIDISDDANNKSAFIVNGFRIVHYYAEPWQYQTNIIEVSSDGTTWTTLYDASIHGAYTESANGIAIIYDTEAQGPYSRIDTGAPVVPIPYQIPVRYIRNTIGSPTRSDSIAISSPGNRWSEVEVYADWWYTQEYTYDAADLGADAGAALGVRDKSATGTNAAPATLIGDALVDANLAFLTNKISNLTLWMSIDGNTIPFKLAVLEGKDYSAAGPNTYDVLAYDIMVNANAIIQNQNTLNGTSIPQVYVSNSNGQLVFSSTSTAATNSLQVYGTLPMTLSGMAAKTDVSNAYVEANIDIEYTASWYATFIKGAEMGVAIVLTDNEITGDVGADWYPTYLVMSAYSTQNGSYAGDKLKPGKHKVRFTQSSGTVVFDRFKFEDYQMHAKTFTDISTATSQNTWKRERINGRETRNYVGKGNQMTYGPFDSIRVSPVTGLPDGSCEIKYRIKFRNEIEQSATPSQGTMYVTGVVFEKGKLSTHWRSSEANDVVTTVDVQPWSIEKPDVTGIQSYHLANGAVDKYKLKTHIVEDFHISPFAKIAEYKLKLNYPTHPHANKVTLDQITGWGTSGTSTNIAREDHTHNNISNDISVAGNISVTGTVDGVDVSGFKSTYDTHVKVPNAPTALVLTENGTTVSVGFTTSTSAEATEYEIWSSIGDSSSYKLIGLVNKADITGTTATFVDDTYNRKTTIYYKVYAKNGDIRSTALTGNAVLTHTVADPTNLQVVANIDSFDIHYVIPSDRLLDHVELLVGANATEASLSESAATVVYSGLSSHYTYKIPSVDYDKFHEMWVRSVTRT